MAVLRFARGCAVCQPSHLDGAGHISVIMVVSSII